MIYLYNGTEAQNRCKDADTDTGGQAECCGRVMVQMWQDPGVGSLKTKTKGKRVLQPPGEGKTSFSCLKEKPSPTPQSSSTARRSLSPGSFQVWILWGPQEAFLGTFHPISVYPDPFDVSRAISGSQLSTPRPDGLSSLSLIALFFLISDS